MLFGLCRIFTHAIVATTLASVYQGLLLLPPLDSGTQAFYFYWQIKGLMIESWWSQMSEEFWLPGCLIHLHNRCSLVVVQYKDLQYCSTFFKFSLEDMFIGFWREGKRERDRNIEVREKHLSISSHTRPNQGLNRQPKYVPRVGVKPMTFQFMRWHSNQ